MTISDERVSKLIETLTTLAEISGTYAETRIVPNLEVIDNAPADLSADYIIIKNEEGYYAPAVKVAGLTVAIGDLVNVLYVKGTEPIAFQQGSGSSGYGLPLTTKGDILGFSTLPTRIPVSGNNGYVLTEDDTKASGLDWVAAAGGNVWPKPGEANISDTAYTAIDDFFDALTGGVQGIIGEGSFATDWTGGHAAVPTGADVKGSGVGVTVLTSAEYVIEVEGESLIEQLTIANTVATGDAALLQDTGGNGRYDTVRATATATSGTAIGFYIYDGNAELINCEAVASGGTNNYALYAYDNGTGTNVTVRGGKYAGDVIADQAGATIHLDGPTITGSVTEANSGVITGHYYNASGNLIQRSAADVFSSGMTSGVTPRLNTAAGNASGLITHHRGETLATGQTWQGAPFATPGSVTNSPDDYLAVVTTAGTPVRCFASLPIINAAASWQNKYCRTRVTGATNIEHGLRVDVGDDTTYAEIYATGAAANGTISISFRYRINSGAVVTVASSVAVPAYTFVGLQLFCYWNGANYYFYGYIYSFEVGQTANITNFLTPAVTAYVPAAGRFGYLASAPGIQNVGVFDFLISTFA